MNNLLKMNFVLLLATILVVQGNQVLDETSTGLRGGSSATSNASSSIMSSALNFIRRRLDIGGCFNFETCGGNRPPPADEHAWTGRTSDGQPPANCGNVFRSAHTTATGIRCFGDNCSEIQLRCTDTYETNNFDRVRNTYWSNRFSEESENYGRSVCRDNHFLTGISCDGRRCDNPSIECTEVFGRTHDQESCYWTDEISEEFGGELIVPEGFFVRGIDCDNGFCDNKHLYICRENLREHRPSLFEDRPMPQNRYTDFTTDGWEPVTCGSRYTLGRTLINGFQCRGSHCDDIALGCTRPVGSRLSDTADSVMWTPMFSEEYGGRQICPENHFMTGLHCDGSRCNNLSMECTRVVGRNRRNCRWTNGRVSEENGGNLYTGSQYVAGIDCDDDYCDNKRLYVCDAQYN